MKHVTKQHTQGRAFTIIELLVVVSIIALLVGILLPAIGKARDQALLTQSQSNMRQLVTALNIYGAEWNDRQITLLPDSIASYGNDLETAWDNYTQQGGVIPASIAGYDTNGNPWGFFEPGSFFMPITFNDTFGNNWSFYGTDTRWGYFRAINNENFNQYINGRYYDRVFWAPKDKVVLSFAEECLDSPATYCQQTGNDIQGRDIFMSYCYSPAALLNSQVLAEPDKGGYTDPFSIGAGLKTPTISQARFPELKTLMLEHHQLQNAPADCNPDWALAPQYEECEPYYFNHGENSAPVTSFFDGHVESLSTSQAVQASLRNQQQAGFSLWARDTPFGNDGYYNDLRHSGDATSFHIFTTNGIRGRDKDAN